MRAPKQLDTFPESGNMRFSSLLIAAVIVSLSALPVLPQNQAAISLNRAQSFYKAGNYDSTITVLQSWLKKNGKADSAEFIVPLLLESLIRKNEYRYFDKLFSIYEQKFPESDFMPRAYYLKGVVLARQENREEAVVSFSKALTAGAAQPVDSMSLRNVKTLCAETLTDAELTRLAARSDLHQSVTEIAAYYEFSRLYESDRAESAKQKAEAFRKKFPDSAYDIFAREIISKSRNVQRKQIPIGLLAPLSGADSDIGRHVMQAVALAVDQHNEVSSVPVRLITGDTEGKMIRTAALTREMITVSKTPVIIGPVLSMNAIVCASMLLDKNVVMITPTATDDGIAGLGRNIFQLNVTPATLGKSIASYAMANLMIRDFAIMSPSSEYGRILSENFCDEIKKRGGEIVSKQYYEEGLKDFRIQFDALRHTLLVRRRHNLAAQKGLEYSPSPNEKEIKADSARLADSLLLVGGLFIPAESEDVVVLAPQTHFHRIQTQMLGTAGWHTPTTLQTGKQYVNNAVISTNFEIRAQDAAWTEFNSLYRKKYGMEPDRIAAPLAWDAAKLALKAIDRYDDDAIQIGKYLHTVKKYNGLSGNISFQDSCGYNSEASIIKIKENSFVKIQ
jgi:ABC-type branched-subunit amino acid transport system substrate-binding protein